MTRDRAASIAVPRELPAVPRRVHMELTARCDLHCMHCAAAMHERRRGDMDYAFFLRTAATLRRLGVVELGLSHLGEPFLCRWLPEAVHHAKRDLGFPFVFVTTNGRMATPERVRDCMEAGLDSLEFSYNTVGPDQFHYVTGAREQDFWKLEVNLMAARLVRDEVEARSGHRCALVASSIRFDAAQVRRMQRALKRIRASVDAHYWRPLRGPCGLGGEHAECAKPCRALFQQAHITHDGYLSACAYDNDDRFHMGDLSCETFLEAWHAERFAELRAAHMRGDVAGTACESCVTCQ
ncbi:MAG TPA: radical SAM protein [Burkholderiales bacterium]